MKFVLSIDEKRNLLNEYVEYKVPDSKNKMYDFGMHIRGGDIFSNSAHKLYVQPPLSYYTGIICDNKDKNIIVVSQDNKNPVVAALKKNAKGTECRVW